MWKFSSKQIDDIFLNFTRKQDLTLHANCLLRRQFAWSVKSYSLGKIRKYFRMVSAEIFTQTYNKTCATSKDSDQPAHQRSLIRVFADGMCLLQPQDYPKKDKWEPMPYWVDVQADESLCWSNRSYCRFCLALAYFSHFSMKCCGYSFISEDQGLQCMPLIQQFISHISRNKMDQHAKC